MNHEFDKLIKFFYNNRYYQAFISRSGKMAFLEIDVNDKYHYPKYEELNKILDIFFPEHLPLMIRDSSKKGESRKFSFIPKFFYKGILLTLTVASLTACGSRGVTHKQSAKVIAEMTEEEKAQQQLEKEKKADERFKKYLALADDEYDWKYANDYEKFDGVKSINVKDSKVYDQIFGYSKIPVEKIQEAINNSQSIPNFFQNFMCNFVYEWSELYPDSDLSALYFNVVDNKQPFRILEVSENEMLKKTLSPYSYACYVREENTIYVLEGTDFSRNSNGFIILVHELTHPSRTVYFYDDNGYKVSSHFYNSTYMGYYNEEALITTFAYEMQGLNGDSRYYTLQCNYYKIILDCIDYTGTDYMNHSVNYLIDKMDEFMGTKEAYHIISLIDCQTPLDYSKYVTVDFNDFDPIYNYLTRMYMKKHLSSDMSYDDAKEVYNEMMSKITCLFDKMTEPYDINYDEFEKTFEECANSLGIQKGYVR